MGLSHLQLSGRGRSDWSRSEVFTQASLQLFAGCLHPAFSLIDCNVWGAGKQPVCGMYNCILCQHGVSMGLCLLQTMQQLHQGLFSLSVTSREAMSTHDNSG